MKLSFQLLWVLLLWPLAIVGRASQKNILDQGQLRGPARPYLQGQLLTMAWHGQKHVLDHEQLIKFHMHEACQIQCCEPHPLEFICLPTYVHFLKGIIAFCIVNEEYLYLCAAMFKQWLFKPVKPSPKMLSYPQ